MNNKQSMNSFKKIEWIQFLRCFAAFAVVNLHVLYQSFLLSEKTDTLEIYFYNFSIFAVPVFIMITGNLWLSNQNKKFNLVKAEKRIITPLISFGFIFALMEVVFSEHTLTWKGVLTAIYNVISDSGWAHLWYLYILIGLYLIIPILKASLKEYGDKFAILGILVIVIVNGLFPDLDTYFGLKIGIKLPLSGIYVAYLLLGYYLPKLRLSNLVLLINWALILFLIIYFSFKGIRLGSNSFLVCWLASSIFYLFFHLSKMWQLLYVKIVDNLASLTFGIYIIHMFFINIFFKVIHINPYNHNVVLYWFLLTFVVFVLSAISTYVIKRIPIVNKLFSV